MSNRSRINTEDSNTKHKGSVSSNADMKADKRKILASEKTPLLGNSVKSDDQTSYRSRTFSIKSVKGAFGSVSHTISASIRYLQKSVGFLQGFTLIVGILIGSGVFISPSLIMAYTHDAGLSFIVWIACGLIALGGSLCYCELGCALKKAGGNYAYILAAYGNLPAFLCCWAVGFVIDPSAAAAITLTFGTYVMKTFEDLIDPNPWYPKLVAAGCILIVCFINCWSIKAATRAQTLFTIAQVTAVLFIVIVGIWQFAKGTHRTNFQGMFNMTQMKQVGLLGSAMYNGLWAYDGWALISNITEEMTNLDRNLLLSILTGIPFVIVCYLLINLSLLSALSVTEMAESKAVAVTFMQKTLGHKAALVMPLFVALSCYGAANGTIFAAARLSLAAGREGHLPEVYAMIHKTRHTPIPSVLMTSFIALLMLIPNASNLESLIGFFNFSCWLLYGLTIFGVIVLRIKKPDMDRPYKVWLITPIIMTIISLGLVISPFFDNPINPTIALGTICLGIPIYFVFVYLEPKHPECLVKFRKKANKAVKRVFNLAPCIEETG